MSRSGYTDYFEDPLELGRWRAQVASAIRGRRGQRLLRDMLEALDAMPEKRLIAGDLHITAERDAKTALYWTKITGVQYDAHLSKRQSGWKNGDVCALGALGLARNIDMDDLNPNNPTAVAAAFDVARQLAQEIVYLNDECGIYNETPEQRWVRMRAWVADQIRDTKQ